MTNTTETRTVTYRESVDFDRLDKLIAWAEVENEKAEAGLPSEWDQSIWGIEDGRTDCGTACCIAGRVAFEDHVLAINDHAGDAKIIPGVTFPQLSSGLSVASYAQAVLGLPGQIIGDWNSDRLEYNPSIDSRRADDPPRLFGGSNTLEDLKRIRDEYADAEGVPPRYRS